MSHTPGRWRVSNLSNSTIAPRGQLWIEESVGLRWRRVAQARGDLAPLLCAAPELLEALDACFVWMEETKPRGPWGNLDVDADGERQRCLELAAAAIKKARGET